MFQKSAQSQAKSPENGTLHTFAFPGELATQTIDVNSLFTRNVGVTGTFDLSGIGSTSFGKLLEALPTPTLVVDQWHLVAFANQACERVGLSPSVAQARPFADLISKPRDPERAKQLADRVDSLLDRAFQTRKPQSTEAILELDQRKLWTRMHLRSVKIGRQRYVLLIVEDLTAEKTQQHICRREERKMHEAQATLEDLVRRRTEQLNTTNERVRKLSDSLVHSKEQLRAEKQCFETLGEVADCGVARISGEGELLFANRKFTEMMEQAGNGSTHESAPCTGEDCWCEQFPKDLIARLKQASLARPNGAGDGFVMTMGRTDGSETNAHVTMKRLADGSVLVRCRS